MLPFPDNAINVTIFLLLVFFIVILSAKISLKSSKKHPPFKTANHHLRLFSKVQLLHTDPVTCLPCIITAFTPTHLRMQCQCPAAKGTVAQIDLRSIADFPICHVPCMTRVVWCKKIHRDRVHYEWGLRITNYQNPHLAIAIQGFLTFLEDGSHDL